MVSRKLTKSERIENWYINEIVMIPEADTVINPRTVVIKPFNTLMAHSTVTRSGSVDGFTVRIKLCTLNSFVQDNEQ